MEAQNKAYKEFTFTKTFVNGTPATLNSFTVDIPNQFKHCYGVKVFPHQTLFNIRLGIQQSDKQLAYLTHPDNWKTNTAVKYEDQWRPFNFPTGVQLTVTFQPLAALVADQTIDIVFLVE